MSRRNILGACTVCALMLPLAAIVGCGGDSNVGSVTGTVTLDGQPLPDAVVTFSPTSGQSPSMGRTDSNGYYSLVYTRDVDGAEVGEHSVTITTYEGADPDAEPPTPGQPEKVPTKYNMQTTLTATVTAGGNTIDFALDSQGEIIQPDTISSDRY